MTRVDYSGLSKTRPEKSLLMRLKARAGRNSAGRITVRHQGGGNKKLYRLVDFKQDRFGEPAKVETVEYDPYRSAFIAKIVYPDGGKRYILAPHSLQPGDEVVVAELAPLRAGNRMKLKNIVVGSQIHNVELIPGHGGALAPSPGS